MTFVTIWKGKKLHNLLNHNVCLHVKVLYIYI